jgi:hypothetical protein
VKQTRSKSFTRQAIGSLFDPKNGPNFGTKKGVT